MKPFKHLALFAKQQDTRVMQTLSAVYAHLQQQNYEVLLHQSAAHYLQISAHADNQICQQADAALVIGGDGSFLGAARLLAPHNVPLIGISLGRLGFLVDVAGDNPLPALDAILNGEFQQEQRSMLHADIYREQELLVSAIALNEVVLRVKDLVRMIEFETAVNDKFLNIQRADGMIVSTATGSTAYALSAGGPLLSPDTHAMLLLPICSHTFSSRPIVIDVSSKIRLALHRDNRHPAQLVCDGQVSFDIQLNDTINIASSEHRLTLLHPNDYDYFALVREKLGWG